MLLSKSDFFQPAAWGFLAALWAGASLAGNLVAAPAKFQVQTLDLSVALQIGRAQFAWIGIVEWCLVTLITIVLTLRLQIPPLPLAGVILIFLIQQFWLQPLLQVRSDLLISGQSVPLSHIHLIFAVLELLKFLSLLLYSGIAIAAMSRLADVARDG